MRTYPKAGFGREGKQHLEAGKHQRAEIKVWLRKEVAAGTQEGFRCPRKHIFYVAYPVTRVTLEICLSWENSFCSLHLQKFFRLSSFFGSEGDHNYKWFTLFCWLFWLHVDFPQNLLSKKVNLLLRY